MMILLVGVSRGALIAMESRLLRLDIHDPTFWQAVVTFKGRRFRHSPKREYNFF